MTGEDTIVKDMSILKRESKHWKSKTSYLSERKNTLIMVPKQLG